MMDYIIGGGAVLSIGWFIFAAWYLDSIPPEEMRAGREEWLKHHKFWWER